MTSHSLHRLIGDEDDFIQPSAPPEGWPKLVAKLRDKSEHPYGSMATHKPTGKPLWLVHE